MKTIAMTNPTDINGVEEYRELFWVPSLNEHRELTVWREANGSYAYDYGNGARFLTGFATGQAAYEAGMLAVRDETPDAQDDSFDLIEFFNNIPDDPVKSKLFRALYLIQSVCQQNWNEIPGDAQSRIIDAVQEALAVVRHLPDGLPE